MNVIAQLMQDDLDEVVRIIKPSLVSVTGDGHSSGSGIVWHSDGLIVTNAHVVRHGTNVTLPDGRRLPARLLAMDERLDIAALYIEASGLKALALGDSRTLKPGAFVLSIGNPWGVAGAVSAGAIVAAGSDWSERPLVGREWIATDLHLRPGNSGGPLVNARGELVGINAMVMEWDLGIAVPAHVVQRFLNMEGIRFDLKIDGVPAAARLSTAEISYKRRQQWQ